jgi:hypothetical protein
VGAASTGEEGDVEEFRRNKLLENNGAKSSCALDKRASGLVKQQVAGGYYSSYGNFLIRCMRHNYTGL